MYIPKANFYLKNINSIEPTLISLQLKFNGHRVVMSTGEKILPANWNFEKQRAVGIGNSDLNYWLDRIDNEAKSIFRNFNIDNIIPNTELVLNTLKSKLDNTPIAPIEPEKPITLFSFVEKYIEEVRGVKKYETIKAHKTTLNHLKNYAELYNRNLDFDSIDMEFYYSFSDYISKDLGNSKNTVAKHIKTLKTFLREATERGINSNMTFQSKNFKKVTEFVDKIYLTKEEILRIYNLDLSNAKTKGIARDLFIISCYTGLRFSDLVKIKKENIIDNNIHISTTKTEQYIVIPIASLVKRIFEKYNYNIPNKISNQKMNKYLKEIGEMAHIEDDVLISKTIAGKRKTKIYRKYELISAHCGRRSFATNAYKDGIPAISIMKITGHTSEKTFLGYIRISQEENAELLRSHIFFN